MDRTFVEKDSPIPLYYQLSEVLKTQIEEGNLEPHERLPSERELSEHYDVSRMTARKALSEIESEGYIYRSQGKGSFVAEPKLRQSLFELTSYTEDMKRRGLTPGAKVLNIEVIDNDEILADKLEASPEESFVKIQRIRLADDEPMALETSHLRRKYCAGIEELDFDNRSLYNTLKKEFNVKLKTAEQWIEATLADDFQSKWLKVKKGSPMLSTARTTYMAQGNKPIEFAKAVYRGDKYKLFVKLNT